MSLLKDYCCLIALVTLYCSKAENNDEVDKGVSDYCKWQSFQPECAADEVVVITSAWYGRMAHGSCIRRDYGYVGCQDDVLSILGRRCSGRNSCKVTVPDEELDKVSRCPDDLIRYLTVGYLCRRIFASEAESCTESSQLTVPLPSAYLSSVTTMKTRCGSSSLPWIIDVQKGQKLTIVLHDFTIMSSATENNTSHCLVYAIVKELRSGVTRTVCGGSSIGANAYETTGTSVELRILPGTDDKLRYFLLHYKVSGCADINPPVGGFAERMGNVTNVRCGDFKSTYKLVCEGNNWKGEKPDCLSVANVKTEASQSFSLGLFTLSETSIIVIVIIAFVIAASFFAVGLCCISRRNRSGSTKPSTTSAKYYADIENHASGAMLDGTYKTKFTARTSDTYSENVYESPEDDLTIRSRDLYSSGRQPSDIRTPATACVKTDICSRALFTPASNYCRSNVVKLPP